MRDRNDLRAKVIDSLEDQIAVIDKAGMIVDVNAAWHQFAVENGLPPEFASAGIKYLDVLKASPISDDALADEIIKGILQVLRGGSDSFSVEYPCHSPEAKRWFLMRVVSLNDAPDDLFVVSHRNITERKHAEQKVERLDMHDPLTGLANRRYFDEAIGREVRRNVRNELPVSLLMIDVDFFKDYSDELGRSGGDQCLLRVSEVLRAFSHRATDLAARLGGDEFALILGGVGATEAREIAEAIHKTVYDLGLVFGDSRRVTISIGAVSANPLRDLSDSLLFLMADKALHHAKSNGRNRVVHESIEAINESG